jgi:hypothetical protein
MTLIGVLKYNVYQFYSKTNNLNNSLFKYAISSNKLSRLNETLCTLKLYSNETKNEVQCEMNKDELDRLIGELEKIDNTMGNY